MTGEKDDYRAMVDRVNSMRDDGTTPGEPKRKPSTIDSPFNACCRREQCKALEARALAAEAALAGEREEGEFEIRQEGLAVAASSGPRMRALADALHYASVYAQDGPVELVEIVPLDIEKAAAAIRAEGE